MAGKLGAVRAVASQPHAARGDRTGQHVLAAGWIHGPVRTGSLVLPLPCAPSSHPSQLSTLPLCCMCTPACRDTLSAVRAALPAERWTTEHHGCIAAGEGPWTDHGLAVLVFRDLHVPGSVRGPRVRYAGHPHVHQLLHIYSIKYTSLVYTAPKATSPPCVLACIVFSLAHRICCFLVHQV